MIGNKLEQSIISVFQNNLSTTFSINEVSKQLKKSYPTINHKSNFFLKEGILKKIVIGKSYQCFLNLENDKAKVLISINEINNKELFLEKNTDFMFTYEAILRICGAPPYKTYISFILVRGFELVFVLRSFDSKMIAEIRNVIPVVAKYQRLFLSEEQFKTELLNDPLLGNTHTILFNLNNYVHLLEEMTDKLLARGFLDLTKDSDVAAFKTSSKNVAVNSKYRLLHK